MKERKVQASDEKQDTRQPIELKHGRVKNNAAEISGAYNLVNGSVNKLDMSAEIDKTNGAILSATYEADKQLQKILSLVKTRERGKSRGCHPLGGKNLVRRAFMKNMSNT